MPDDYDAALAWMDWEASLCGNCRRQRSETMDPTNDDAYTATPIRCFACAARERSAAEFSRAAHADTAGLYFAIDGPDPMIEPD